MKRLCLLFFLFIISSEICFSQTYNWAWARGAVTNNYSPSNEALQAATDSSENLYIVGDYGYNISFGPHRLQNYGSGFFLAKYDANGNIKWAKGDSSSSASSGDAYAWDMCTDANGNCYLTGGFGDTVYFGSLRLIGGGTFLVKYDSSGNVLWAKSSIDTTGGANGFSVAVDYSGNIYVTGQFGAASISFGPYTLTNSGTSNVFLVKYDSSGNVLWAKSSQGEGEDNLVWSVTADINGNVYLTGSFDSTSISFGTQTLINSNPLAFSFDIFLVKYDSLGNVMWAKRSGGPTDDDGFSVACDLSGNIFQVGSLDYPRGEGFITKYDNSGNILWSKNILGNNSGEVSCYEVTTDKRANVYVTGGYYATPINISGDTTLYAPPFASDPLFIVKYDSSGHLLFAKGVSNGGDDECGIAVTKSGSIYLGGDFTDTSFIVGNDTLTYPGNWGEGEQIFVAKLVYEGVQADFSSGNSIFCGAPACANFNDNSTGTPVSWQWFFPGASPDTSSQQNPSGICYMDTGFYNVKLIVSNANASDTLELDRLIQVKAIPPTPIIIQDGDSLISSIDSSSISYQWYFDSIPIPNATNYYYIPTKPGNYNLSLMASDGCITSVGISVGISEVEISMPNIYPNPSTGKVLIYFDKITSVKVYNYLGEIIYKEDGGNYKQKEINITGGKGIYLIVVSDGEREYLRKVIIE